MNDANRSLPLRRALLLNAAFSTLCAGAGLLAGPPLAEAMGLESALPVQIVAAGLAPFVAWLLYLASRQPIPAGDALATSAADFAWVLCSIGLLVGWSSALSPTGVGVVAGVAAIVGVLGTLQLRGLAHSVADRDGAIVVEADRVVTASTEEVWPVVADVDGYAQYATGLAFSRVLEGDTEGMVRECGDHKGRWTESCTLWEEGRRYAFDVHTHAPDYPYPFLRLGGEWSVEPEGVGSRIRMQFVAQPRGGWLGRAVMAAVMVPRARETMQQIFDNWERAIEARPAEAA